MSLWKIAWRSVRQRPLASSMTCLSMALGVALVVAVLITYKGVDKAFNSPPLGFHMIVGGKNGSKTDLVLSTLYHIGWVDEPVTWETYLKFKPGGEYAGSVKRAVPVCFGDSYQDFRVLATNHEMFEFEYSNGKKYEFAEGENFSREEGIFFQAIIGSEVARKTGLKLGSTIHPTHGASDSGTAHVHEEFDFKVVGILERTGTPNDRAVFIHIEGFYLLPKHNKDGSYNAEEHSHSHEGGATHFEPLPNKLREVSAIFVLCGTQDGASDDPEDAQWLDILGPDQLHKSINEGPYAQAAFPLTVIGQLKQTFVDPLLIVLLSVTILTVIVAGIGVMVSIYNSMAGRRHEIAVLRALGARRNSVMAIVMLESMILSVVGGISGLVLGHLVFAIGSPILGHLTGLSLGYLEYSTLELVIIPGLIALSSIVGYLPAIAAYRTNVVKGLSASE